MSIPISHLPFEKRKSCNGAPTQSQATAGLPKCQFLPCIPPRWFNSAFYFPKYLLWNTKKCPRGKRGLKGWGLRAIEFLRYCKW